MGNRSRINRLKNFLIFGPYVIMLVPIIMCVILLLITQKQSRQIELLSGDVVQLKNNQDTLVVMLNDTSESLNVLADEINTLSEHVDKVDIDRRSRLAAEQRDDEAWPKKVYLTFDDGPSPNTAKILDILAKYGVKGNFFVVGTDSENLKKYYKRILDEGHVLGMHSYSHKYNEIYASKQAFIDDLDHISGLIKEQTGEDAKIYRFPGGSSNNVSKVSMKELIEILNERGITYYDWNVLSGDATNPMLPAEDIIANSLNNISDYEEAMILFHDLSNKSSTVEALPTIIETLLEQGITIAPIDDKTMLIQHNTNK